VWTAVDRNLLRFAGFKVGDVSSKTFRKFWNKIAKTNDVEMVCTDGNLSYVEIFAEDAVQLAYHKDASSSHYLYDNSGI
jgi:IS1 family transposase